MEVTPTTNNISAPPQQSYSEGSGFFDKQITMKQIVIGLGILALGWYLLKQHRENAVQKAMLNVNSNGTINNAIGGQSNDKIKQIRYKLDDFLAKDVPDNESRKNIVMSLTTI